ncbi:hypothetical protein [Arthrobacter sp. Soil764]|uniref:hypothetical protein n=1 Tax=Arthrobacter sp. Soil764 TaxID=1736403 RepID=UPI000B103E57|nr:hypothetical protein [Arthrobacter sp. Soil764]
MDPASGARRIAAGPLPSQLLGGRHGTARETPSVPPGSGPGSTEEAPFDPLRLCIFATIALLGWLAGPLALSVFSAIGLIGYWKARRRGLKKSKCYLRDTRLVLAYLGVLLASGVYGIYLLAGRMFGV